MSQELTATDILPESSPYKYFSVFWWSYAVIPVTGLLLIMMYLTHIDILFLFKVPLSICVLVLVAFHLRYRLVVTGTAVLFGIWGVFGLGIGALSGRLFTPASLTHLYMSVMPILATSFGYHFAKNETPETERLMRRVMGMLFWLSTLTLLLYFYFYYVTKSIDYFGFDSSMPLASVIMLADSRYFAYAVSLALVFFSGKRAPLIAMLSPVLLMLLRSFALPRFANILFALITIAVVGTAGYFAAVAGLLYRFEPLTQLDVSDSDQFYVATSGRSTEFLGLLTHLQEDPMRWWTGSGIGGQYWVDSNFRGEYVHEQHHYLHLSLLTYLLVFGAPFLVAFIGYVISIFWKNRKRMNSFYYLAMLVTFVGATFGATLIVEPVFWFFLGANVFMARQLKGRVT